jgi:hypothetical protein
MEYTLLALLSVFVFYGKIKMCSLCNRGMTLAYFQPFLAAFHIVIEM